MADRQEPWLSATIVDVPSGPHGDDSEGHDESGKSLRWSTGEILPPDAPDAGVLLQQTNAGDQSWRVEPSEICYVKEIGAGSFGAVYTAKLRGVDVAVKKLYKTMDADSMKDFVSEVSIMTKLRHPNVLLFMGASIEPANLLIVTEYMPRGSVHDVLHDAVLGPRLTFDAKLDIARQAAQGMNWLHLSKPPFLHRDLKTANLLVDRNWTVKVCDFGLTQVKRSSMASNAAESTDDDGPVGTPLWMAPEILMGEKFDESSDVYSYGIVLWELFTRQEPYPEISSYEDLVHRVCELQQRPEWPIDVPSAYKALAARCWAPQRSARPTFTEILASFNDIRIDALLLDRRARRFWKKQLYTEESVAWGTLRWLLQSEIDLVGRYSRRTKTSNESSPSSGQSSPQRQQRQSQQPTSALLQQQPPQQNDVTALPSSQSTLSGPSSSSSSAAASAADTATQSSGTAIGWRCMFALIMAVQSSTRSSSESSSSALGSLATPPPSTPSAAAQSSSVSTTSSPHGSVKRSSSLNAATSSNTRIYLSDAAADATVIHMADFGRFLQYFGPMTTDILDRCEALLRAPWFWGDVPTALAENLVQRQGAGSFLVRFSSSDIGGFSITALSRSGRTKHFRIAHRQQSQASSLAQSLPPSLDAAAPALQTNVSAGQLTNGSGLGNSGVGGVGGGGGGGAVFQLGAQTRSSLFAIVEDFSQELFLKIPVEGSPFLALFKDSEIDDDSAYFNIEDINDSYATLDDTATK